MAKAQTDDEELKRILSDPNISLKLTKVFWGPDQTAVYCDLSDSTLRPFVPLSLRERLFKLFHNPAHPGAKASDRLIRKRYVWPSMHKDIKAWCRACLDCQQSKVTRHTQLRLPISSPLRRDFDMSTLIWLAHFLIVRAIDTA